MGKISLTYTDAQEEIFFNRKPTDKYIIVTKGRRFGATKGAANALIEFCLQGKKVLWGDTINGNIDRYFDRYIEPELRTNKIEHRYSRQMKQLTIGNGLVDFRSADRSENWEGFGYDIIILNEAGIILKNKYLYTNAVLPMLMDNPMSVLFAMGVPKGKYLKDLTKHPFFQLYEAAKSGAEGYVLYEYTSYDNPFLSQQAISELEQEIARMNAEMVQQEIYGKFIEGAHNILWTHDIIRYTDTLPKAKRIVIGNDPSGSKDGDAVGIVTAMEGVDGYYYVLADRTGNYTPNEWGSILVREYSGKKADAIVVERNFGGDMVKAIIHNIDKRVRVIEVVASKGKVVRAEPIVGLYEQGLVRHARGLEDLELEMLTWTQGSKSPNRIDALVWALTELSTKNSAFVLEF